MSKDEESQKQGDICTINFVTFADNISKERGLRTSEHMNTNNIKILILTALVLL